MSQYTVTESDNKTGPCRLRREQNIQPFIMKAIDVLSFAPTQHTRVERWFCCMDPRPSAFVLSTFLTPSIFDFIAIKLKKKIQIGTEHLFCWCSTPPQWYGPCGCATQVVLLSHRWEYSKCHFDDKKIGCWNNKWISFDVMDIGVCVSNEHVAS